MVVIPAYFASTLAAARGSGSSSGGGDTTKMSYGGHECRTRFLRVWRERSHSIVSRIRHSIQNLSRGVVVPQASKNSRLLQHRLEF